MWSWVCSTLKSYVTGKGIFFPSNSISEAPKKGFNVLCIACHGKWKYSDIV